MNDRVYHTVNNGVYRAGFAGTQAAYDRAVHELFDTLDLLEERLRTRRWLVGNVFTEADLRLFPTLVRFDAVYHAHFKCNLRMVRDYPALFGWTRDIYQLPGVRETVDFPEIRRHYFFSHRGINPRGVIPVGAAIDFSAPTGRSLLGPSPLERQ
jgi:putative glutathione S-transferase